MGKKKKIVAAAAGLFVFLAVCTLISKSVYAYRLPQVTTAAASKKSIGKKIELSGTVMQTKDHAVSVLPGVKIETVEVTKGQKVQEGDLLFTVSMEDLEEQILEKRLSIQKLQVQIRTLLENNELINRKKVTETNRALEDYVGAVSENDALIGRARQKEEQAKQDLSKHLEEEPQLTKDSDRERERDEYARWKEEGMRLEERVSALQKQLRQAQEEADRLQKEYDEAIKAQGTQGAYFSEETLREEGAVSPEAESVMETEPESTAPPEPEGIAPAESEDAVATEPEPESAAPPESESTAPSEPESTTPPEPGTDTDLEELKKRLDAAKARRDEIERQLKQAQEALLKHQAEGRTEPDFSAEDAERKSWESQKTTLERNVESAGWEEEDAVLQKQKALKEAQRKVDDAASPENAQDTLALYQLELDYEQTVLSRYEQLQKAGGEVTAKEDGVLTGVGVSAGADTPDGAAMTYASLEENLKFWMNCPKEQKKYISPGTQGRLLADGIDETLEIGYMEQREDGSWDAEITLPQNSASMGQGGIFTVDYQSESYSQCVPAEAVYTENGRSYVYVVRRQQGILGEELAAEKRYVTVEETGDRYAALAEGSLKEGEEVVVSTTKALKDGEVIRYRLKEE
ncbi:MAG: biotin/lipoyl-binding protein [Firmicutes bacterium]|nr:biotin/lipoyl-binding protein [Bacillota bacterium]